ncbi:MAG: hypothetical protein AAGA29_10880 [Planctomycetota bacterium]
MYSLGVTLLILMAVVGIVSPIVVVVWYARRYRRQFGRVCGECGYSMRGSDAEHCPECGYGWRGPPGAVALRVERRVVLLLCVLYLFVLPLLVGLAFLLLEMALCGV